jgi:hypothetical protein
MITQPNRLHEVVAEVIATITERCPEARVRISYQPYETEDANLHVYPPPSWDLDQCWDLREGLSQYCSDLFLSEGYFIAVLVVEPQDQVRRDRADFLASMQEGAS